MARPKQFTPEEAHARCNKQRTMLNWKKQFGIQIPIELFDEFKTHKKFYIQCFKMNPQILKRVMEADPPPEILISSKTA